jgi:uncharacterized protein YdaU (DUF1376 family)
MARTPVDHYIPFFGRDFYASTAMWKAEEVGHYIRLLVIQWDSGSLPSEIERLEFVSPGVSKCWGLLETKFPVCDDGQRRNLRMEEHRAKAAEIKAKREEAGRAGGSKSQAGRKQTVKQNSSKHASKTQANGQANAQANVKHPSPSPSPYPIHPQNEKDTHYTGGECSRFFQPGWAADEWGRFVACWNVTERAARWDPLTAPSGWVEHAASPGWLDKARQAMARLPRCEFFTTPLAVTRFFEYVDRILAGEFDHPKQDSKRPIRQPAGGNL